MKTLDVVGHINIESLDRLYEDMQSCYTNTLYYSYWKNQHQRAVEAIMIQGTGLKLVHASSWFDPKIDRELDSDGVMKWHVDIDDMGMCYTFAYPTTTEFKLAGKIVRPALGEIVRVNLSSVLHRTPADAEGKPRLLVRFKETL